jgi:hypothetical protein
MRAAMRKREAVNPRYARQAEADPLGRGAGNNSLSIWRESEGSVGGLVRGEHTNVVHTYLRDLSCSATSGRIKRARQKQVRFDGKTEVGLRHSSVETGENRWSEGCSKWAIPCEEARLALEARKP